MLFFSSEINLSYALRSRPNPTIPNFGIFQNIGTNYKAGTTHKLKPSPVGSETQNPNDLGIPSLTLSPVEWNYEIHDKEMLAIIHALEEWWHFLEGAWHKFETWTNHKNLENFWMSKKLNRHQARWSLYLSHFNFTLHHQPGKSMGKMDALSWRSDHASGARDNDNLTLLPLELFAVRVLEGLTAMGEERALFQDLQKVF